MIQSPQVEVLGITAVSGDQWRDEEVAHTLRLLEIIGRTDIPVVSGAVFPLVRSRERRGSGSNATKKLHTPEPSTIIGGHEPFVVPTVRTRDFHEHSLVFFWK